MPRICYVDRKFSVSSTEMIEQANRIIDEYRKQDFDLTLRQLYYQFVSRDLLRNTQQEYKRLGSVINDARLAGLIDWEAIVDRTRNLRSLAHWESPEDIVRACARQYRVDKWAHQPTRLEVWIEKDALVGVIEGVCQKYDVPFFSCRGYTSQSEMWSAARRFLTHTNGGGQNVHVIHLGDHDPSGIDMSRDIEDRIRLFMGKAQDHFSFTRIALNMAQVDQYKPPPNPAKLTDSRSNVYVEKYGDDSWELDALDPTALASLIEQAILKHRKQKRWDYDIEEEKTHRAHLTLAADRLRDEA